VSKPGETFHDVVADVQRQLGKSEGVRVEPKSGEQLVRELADAKPPLPEPHTSTGYRINPAAK